MKVATSQMIQDLVCINMGFELYTEGDGWTV